LLHPEPSKLVLAFAMDALVQWHESCSAVGSQIVPDRDSSTWLHPLSLNRLTESEMPVRTNLARRNPQAFTRGQITPQHALRVPNTFKTAHVTKPLRTKRMAKLKMRSAERQHLASGTRSGTPSKAHDWPNGTKARLACINHPQNRTTDRIASTVLVLSLPLNDFTHYIINKLEDREDHKLSHSSHTDKCKVWAVALNQLQMCLASNTRLWQLSHKSCSRDTVRDTLKWS